MPMDPVASRARTASAAASGYLMDFGQSFQPFKRARLLDTLDEDHEMDIHSNEEEDASSAPAAPPPPSPTLVERLLMGMASSSAWRMSKERTIEQNESYLNEQLRHAALLSSGNSEMLVEQSQLQFAALIAMAIEHGTKQQQQRSSVEVESHVRHVMDIVSWLLVVRHQEIQRQEEIMERVRIADKDIERKQNQIKQLHLDVDTLQQQMAQQENMFHAREQALVVERRALQQDKKQLEVMCAKLQGQEMAFKAQVRRKEVEYERLKKSLQDAAQRSAKEQRGMAMGKALNGLSERRRATAQSSSPSHETMLTKRLIENLERKRDELLFENEALALNFDALQKQVESVSAQYKRAVQLFLAQRGGDGNHAEETQELARMPIDDFTPTPLQLGVKANVSAYIATTVGRLGDKVRQFERAMQAELEFSMTRPSGEDLVEALKLKLEDAHALISEQDKLLQASLVAPPSPAIVHVAGQATASPLGGQKVLNDKENIHVNTGKPQIQVQIQTANQSQNQNQNQPSTRMKTGGGGNGHRRRCIEHVLLEQWAEEMEVEWQDVKRKQGHLDDERKLLQTQGEKLDHAKMAFEMRHFEHFFGGLLAKNTHTTADRQEEEEIEIGDIDMRDMDCPTTPRTATYLRSIGIFPSVVE